MLRALLAAVFAFVAGSTLSTPFASAAELDPKFIAWVEGTSEIGYRDLARRFLEAGKRDVSGYESALVQLEKRFRAFLDKNENPSDPARRVDLLRRFIFVQEGFSADLDLRDPDNLFPDSIVQRRRGFCLGLSLLLADLGERLGWPLQIAAAPRHTFVRYPGKPAINVETTLGGEIHDDDWYRRRYSVAKERKELLRTLTPRESAAHLINNHGYVLLERGKQEDAEREFARALKLSPNLVEAKINRGVLRARQSKFKEALTHFDAALAAWPGDAFVQLNRINTLLALQRFDDAVTQLVTVAGTHPDLPGLDRAEQQLREHFQSSIAEPTMWRRLQRMVTGLNGARAERNKVPGLVGTYFSDSDLKKRQWSRVDRDLSFRWSWNSPGRGIPRDHFSIRWDGWLEVPADDKYTFFITCSDGVRIWIDGRQVINSWRRANDSFPKGSIELLEGIHDIRVEYFESIGEAGIAIILGSKKQERPLPLADHIFHTTP